VLECGQISQEIKTKLKEQYDQLNPADLRRRIQAKLEKLNRANQIIINQTINLKPRDWVTFSPLTDF